MTTTIPQQLAKRAAKAWHDNALNQDELAIHLQQSIPLEQYEALRVAAESWKCNDDTTEAGVAASPPCPVCVAIYALNEKLKGME